MRRCRHDGSRVPRTDSYQNMVDVVHITACRLCDSPDLELVVSFTPTPIGDHYVTEAVEQPCYPLDLVCCRGCGAVQLADTVDPRLIYPDTYLYTTSVSKGLTEHYDRYAEDVLKRCAGSHVVDIGSNDGTLLRAFQARGKVVQGVDPSKAIASQATKAGIPTTCAFFSYDVARQMRDDDGSADIITANHILANVADVHEFVDGVRELLAPDGTFVFETGYWPAIVDNNLIDTIEHEHIHYFAVKPLRQFFARHGLRLMHVEQNTAKGGSLRGYVQHMDVGYIEGTVADMVKAEGEGAYADIGRLCIWAEDIEEIERGIRYHARHAQQETWVGYGAAVGSTLQLHQFGLGEKLLCLVDDNPAKQGRLSPGYHLRVVPPSELKAIKPDKIVILAWRYAEMIQRQHPEFAGKWIVPLPELVTA